MEEDIFKGDGEQKKEVPKEKLQGSAGHCKITGDQSAASSSKPVDVSVKVKEAVKKFIKSLTKTEDRIRTKENCKCKENWKIFSLSKFKERIRSGYPSDCYLDQGNGLKFSEKEQYKEYESWESMTSEIDKNITENFNIRGRYDATRPVDVSPPKQYYYCVDGYGLISQKFLPDFKRLEEQKLLQSVDKSRSVGNIKSNYYEESDYYYKSNIINEMKEEGFVKRVG